MPDKKTSGWAHAALIVELQTRQPRTGYILIAEKSLDQHSPQESDFAALERPFPACPDKHCESGEADFGWPPLAVVSGQAKLTLDGPR